MNKLVSVIMPSYNSKRYIQDAIESVMSQSYGNWEMIIVDDCSTDDSVEFIRRLIDGEGRITLITLDINTGAALARNKAIELAKGQYVAFLDSDDMWAKDKLKIQVNYMLENNSAFSYMAYRVCNEAASEIIGEIAVPLQLNLQQYLGNTIIGCLTVMLDAEKFNEIKMPNLRSSHDMALWADLLKLIDKADGINIPLSTYRLVETSNTANKWKASMDVWAVYRNHLKLNIFSSSYHFVQYAFNAMKKRMYK
ncbi:MAG: glycosyltransferase family 2 protein [Cocleimonas sp.]